MSEHRPRCAARSDSAECICYDLGRERAAAIEDAAQAVEALADGISEGNYHTEWERGLFHAVAAIRALVPMSESLRQEDMEGGE